MRKLSDYINNEKNDLIIWDFDGVIYDLDWYYPNHISDYFEILYSKINSIDRTIIKDKTEFIARLFPYPEINEVGVKYGREVQLDVKSLYLKREMTAVKRAIPNVEVIDFIKKLNKHQAIWSNNYSNTINYLLNKAGIKNKIEFIASFEKVILSKPNIEGFELIKANYPKINKGNILLVGDSLVSDKIAARDAGIKFFHYVKGS